MAFAHGATQLKWDSGTANSKNISVTTSLANRAMDAQDISSSAIMGSIAVKVDCTTTASVLDGVSVSVRYTNGDTDADPDSANEFDSFTHATLLGQLRVWDQDPTVATFPIHTAAKGFIVVFTVEYGTRTFACSAQYMEVTA